MWYCTWGVSCALGGSLSMCRIRVQLLIRVQPVWVWVQRPRKCQLMRGRSYLLSNPQPQVWGKQLQLQLSHRQRCARQHTKILRKSCQVHEIAHGVNVLLEYWSVCVGRGDVTGFVSMQEAMVITSSVRTSHLHCQQPRRHAAQKRMVHVQSSILWELLNGPSKLMVNVKGDYLLVEQRHARVPWNRAT